MTRHRSADDRAVTPVTGIVLTIAVAVILASLVSIHAFGLFGVADGPGPNIDVRFDYNTTADDSVTDSWGETGGDHDGLLAFTFEHGEEVSPERLTVVGAASTSSASFTETDEVGTKEFYEVGDTLRIWVDAEDTVVIVWRDAGGEKTTAVAVWDHGQ